MAKRTGKTMKSDSTYTRTGKPKVEWRGYVTYEMREQDKAVFTTFLEKGNDPLNWLPRILADGTYTLKTDWDSYNNCWRASLYCQKAGHAHAGWSLPARSSDMWTAIRRLAFVHSEVLQEDWDTHPEDTGWNDEKW